MKRSNLIPLFILLLIVPILLTSGCHRKKDCVTEFRTDTEPVVSRFPVLENIESAFWKSSLIGDGRFGPSSYSITGFFVLSDEGRKQIESGFDFYKNAEPIFPKDIEPSVTGFSSFEWYENEEFSEAVLRNRFAGSVYYDRLSGVVFLNVQNL